MRAAAAAVAASRGAPCLCHTRPRCWWYGHAGAGAAHGTRQQVTGGGVAARDKGQPPSHAATSATAAAGRCRCCCCYHCRCSSCQRRRRALPPPASFACHNRQAARGGIRRRRYGRHAGGRGGPECHGSARPASQRWLVRHLGQQPPSPRPPPSTPPLAPQLQPPPRVGPCPPFPRHGGQPQVPCAGASRPRHGATGSGLEGEPGAVCRWRASAASAAGYHGGRRHHCH